MKSLTWLHISDIHFKPTNEWKDSTARQAMLTHLDGELAKHNLRPDLIFCTGDVAYGELAHQPLEEQYRLARDFFDELLQVCGRGESPLPKGRLFLVPGNHDIDRTVVKRSVQESWERWGRDEARDRADEINNWFANTNGDVKEALTRLNTYGRFISDYLPHQQPPAGHLHYASVVDINGIKVGIAGFNSAWTCFSENDDRIIWLAAESQFNHMRQELARHGAELRIGLIHHPWDWFNVADREIVGERCEVDTDFWLHGHTHDLKLHDESTHATLGAGAVTGQAEEEFGYNLVHLNLDRGTGEAFLYEYQKGRGLWDIHSKAGRGEAGRIPIRLPQRIETQCHPKPIAASAAEIISITHPAPPQLRSDQPFPPAAACLCRGPELTKLAAAAQAVPPLPMLIHGFGGLGKTELAVHYLLSLEARSHFGRQRYFVSVEGLEKTAPEDLPRRFWSLLGSALFTQETRPAGDAESVLAALRTALQAHGRPVLLALDNFETPILLDKNFALATLDALAGLTEYGLFLLVTLRDPLPNPRGHFLNLPLMPFADDTAARAVLLHWARMTDNILVPEQEAALNQLLKAAEGWPIQLQMLGILAGEEGLPSLARRCAEHASLADISADHEETDPHRHPHLSCALTYDIPQLTGSARSLLRALALLPTGVPEDWLPFWPNQEAVRLVGQFRLLAASRGVQGEPRRRLLSPMRDYLGHRHQPAGEDLDSLVRTWSAWLKASMPELFDDHLPRQTAAVYLDMHDREVAALVSLMGSGRLRGGETVLCLIRPSRGWSV